MCIKIVIPNIESDKSDEIAGKLKDYGATISYDARHRKLSVCACKKAEISLKILDICTRYGDFSGKVVSEGRRIYFSNTRS